MVSLQVKDLTGKMQNQYSMRSRTRFDLALGLVGVCRVVSLFPRTSHPLLDERCEELSSAEFFHSPR